MSSGHILEILVFDDKDKTKVNGFKADVSAKAFILDIRGHISAAVFCFFSFFLSLNISCSTLCMNPCVFVCLFEPV